MSPSQIKNIDWSLYAIIDKEWLKGKPIEDVTRQICAGGSGIIQYRDKISTSRDFYANALLTQKIAKEYQIPLIINDRIDIALAVEADGVHLGQEDIPWERARSILGEQKIIGGSVHSMDEFHQIKMCDYIGVGAMYPTQTKKNIQVSGIDFLKKIRSMTGLPIVGIGGITIDNVSAIIQAGADGAAIISWLMANDDFKGRAQSIIAKIKSMKNSKYQTGSES